jgi:hypothetical protein
MSGAQDGLPGLLGAAASLFGMGLSHIFGFIEYCSPPGDKEVSSKETK